MRPREAIGLFNLQALPPDPWVVERDRLDGICGASGD